MRDRTKTRESLRRLAERPGTHAEGETAKRLLEKFGVRLWIPKPFDHSQFPRGTRVFYCYWCYRNDTGTVACDDPKILRGIKWLRIKFDNLKQPRWVPVESDLGCHLGLEPFVGDEAEILYRMFVE